MSVIEITVFFCESVFLTGKSQRICIKNFVRNSGICVEFTLFIVLHSYITLEPGELPPLRYFQINNDIRKII